MDIIEIRGGIFMSQKTTSTISMLENTKNELSKLKYNPKIGNTSYVIVIVGMIDEMIRCLRSKPQFKIIRGGMQ